MTMRLTFGGLAACAAALSLAACNKPAVPADAAPADAPPPASAPADAPAAAVAPADASPAPGQEPGYVTAAADPGSPPDMMAAGQDAEACEHWAGEEPYDAARRKQIEDGVEKSCGALKRALPALLAAHGSDPKLKAKLDSWKELAG